MLIVGTEDAWLIIVIVVRQYNAIIYYTSKSHIFIKSCHNIVRGKEGLACELDHIMRPNTIKSCRSLCVTTRLYYNYYYYYTVHSTVGLVLYM